MLQVKKDPNKQNMRARKARQKRRKAREKQFKKQQQKRHNHKDNDASVGSKFFKFIDGIVGTFIPGRNQFAHDRLKKQGIMLAACLVLLFSGGFISYKAQARKDYIASQIQSFSTQDLLFSKTGTQVSAGKPFKTYNGKIVYIPLYVKDTSNIPTNAKKYHILLMPNASNQLNYPVLKTQLISYGSTGRFILTVQSSQAITSQMIHMVLWSGDSLTNDQYSPDDDTTRDSSRVIEALKKRYDTLDFTINLGGSSIPKVNKYDLVTTKKRVRNDNGKMVQATVKTKQLNHDNQYLYSTTNNDYLAYIYNRTVSQKYVDKQKARAKKTYAKLEILINKLKDDHDKLTTSGYKVPKIPDWATSRANNLSNGLPYLYDDIMKTDYLQPFTTTKKANAVFSQVLADYQKDKDNNADDDANSKSKYADDNKVQHYLENLQSATIKNAKLSKTIGAGSDDDGVASSQWDDYINTLQSIYDAKTKLYYSIPLHLYEHYEAFLDTSSWGVDNAKLNSGAITMSNINGKDNAGKFVIVLGNPLS